MDKNIIELKNINKSFDGETILDNLNLCIKDKEFVTFLGPSGCGKTTMLRIIGGFLSPDSGDVIFDGKNITDFPPNKRNLNTVFQRYALFPHLNVFDNIAFGLKVQKLPKDEIKKRVKNMLKAINLEGFDKRRVSLLSGGQQQRIAIARALVNYPKVLLLDEPLGALDLKLRKEMQLELKDIQQKLETTFIYVTHDQEEALTMSDTIVVMNEGEVQQIASPEDIYNKPQNAFVADFIGESNIINGVMKKDFEVTFAGQTFTCFSKGFSPMQPVDVVIRPEHIGIVDKDHSEIQGVVESAIFKGMHYEIEVLALGIYWLVNTTRYLKVGQEVGLKFEPDSIHVMEKLFKQSSNRFIGQATSSDTIYLPLLDISFTRKDLDVKEDSKLVINIPPTAISLVSTDRSDVVLYLESIIYKGQYNEMYFYIEDETDKDHYLLVHSENEEEVSTDLGLKIDFDKVTVKETAVKI